MFIRRLAVTAVLMLASIIVAIPALAQGSKTFAVLPFTYNGPAKYQYFPKAFQASLNNDLEWTGHVEPASSSVVEKLTTPKGKGDAVGQLRSSGIDYLVSGVITILDKEATLSMEAFGTDGSYWENKGQMDIDEITPWLDEQSKNIMGEVFHRPGYTKSEQEAKIEAKENAVVAGPTNSAFIKANDDQFKSGTLNPQFRYEGGTENTGRWRSQTLRFSSTSMVVADGDGDGENEVFILHRGGLSAFRHENGKLHFLHSIDLPSNGIQVRLEAIDLTKNGVPEFVISTYYAYYRSQLKAPEGSVKSSIYSFAGGKFKPLMTGYNRFLGVLRMPPTYAPVLVAQKKGTRGLFEPRVYEAYLKDGDIEIGNPISVPEYGNIYNMVYMPDNLGFKYIVLDDFHRLKVYSQTREPLSSSDEDRYNSSGIGIEYSERMRGMGAGTTDMKTATYNIPFRMIVARLTSKDKHELLANKDLSYAAQIFERFKYYSQGEIHSMAWDGVGMTLAWKTRRIKGQVSDIALADLNNDGKKQLCVLLNTFPGGMGFTNRKTVVVAYDLNL